MYIPISLKHGLMKSFSEAIHILKWLFFSTFTILLLLRPYQASCETGDTLKDNIFRPEIKTVLLHKDGWELSYPLINMGEGEKLKLSFDELTKTRAEYHYIIKHCTAEW